MHNIHKYCTNGQDIIVDLTKSAPNQFKPFPRIYDLCDYWKVKGYKEIIDIGCGYLRNSLVFVDYFRLWICDYPQQMQSQVFSKRLSCLKAHRNFMGIIEPHQLPYERLKVDAVVLAYVIHTLPEEKMRIEIIDNAIRNTKHPHEIFIAVPNGERYYRQHMNASNKFNDGHLRNAGNGRKTFYRGYSAEEIDCFMEQHFNYMKLDKSFGASKKNQRIYKCKN